MHIAAVFLSLVERGTRQIHQVVAESLLIDTTKLGARMNRLFAATGLLVAVLTSLILAGTRSATAAASNARSISAIGFESGLWQREFAPNNKFTFSRAAQSAPDVNLPQNQRKPVASAGNIQRPTEGANGESHEEGHPSAVVRVDLADPIPVIVTVQQTDAYLMQEAAGTSVNDRMISEWDKVMANTVGKDGVGQGFTTTGPTLTTYLVAIVATIVAVGCTITPK